MKNNFAVLIVIIFIAGVYFLTGYAPKSIKSEDIKYVKIAGRNIKVDLALTSAEQAQGLSGRQGLSDDQGMLFVFKNLGSYHFWMKDMNFPIDIIWLDEDLHVIYIKKDARPELYPETYGLKENQQDAKYVLEVVSGFSAKHNLQIGDRVEFLYQ